MLGHVELRSLNMQIDYATLNRAVYVFSWYISFSFLLGSRMVFCFISIAISF